MLEEFIEIVFVILLAQCLEYMVLKKVFDKSKNKIILAHTKAIQCNDKPLDNMAWQKHRKEYSDASLEGGKLWHRKMLKG